jgi:hypothetical protein
MHLRPVEHADFEQPVIRKSAVGRSTFMLSFIQRQHPEPIQPTSGMSPSRKASVAWIVPTLVVVHRELLRIGDTKKCTLSEFRRRCFSPQTQPRQVWYEMWDPQMYLSVVTRQNAYSNATFSRI